MTARSLRTIRRYRFLTQRELAAQAGLYFSTVFNIENGRTQPQLSSIRLLCAALGVEPHDVEEFRQTIDSGRYSKFEAAS